MSATRVVLVGLRLAACGCSDNGSDGTVGNGGSSNPGNAGGSSSVAGSAPSAGNVGSSAAGAGSSAAGATNAGGSSGGPDMADCPLWPQARLLPAVGPFFYGPDPGPCSSHSNVSSIPSTTTWSYQDGKVNTEQAQDDGSLTPRSSKTYVLDATGKPVSSASDAGDPGISQAESFEYGADYLLYTLSRGGQLTQQVRYQLNARGYPIAATLVRPNAQDQFVSYEYEGCRLLNRKLGVKAGTADTQLTFSYDSVGHLVSRLDANGFGDTYSYSCW